MTQEEIDALPDTLTFPLRKPIELGEETYSEITLHEPTQDDLAGTASLDDHGATKYLIAKTSGFPQVVVSKMTVRDLKKAAAFLQSFMQDAQQTGPSA